MDHELELTGSVGPVLPGQTAILVVDQFQVRQAFVNLPLETLKDKQVGFSGVMLYFMTSITIMVKMIQISNTKQDTYEQTNLKLLQLLLGDSIKDVSRVWVGSGALRRLQPIFKL